MASVEQAREWVVDKEWVKTGKVRPKHTLERKNRGCFGEWWWYMFNLRQVKW